MVSQQLEDPTLWPHKKINLGLDLQGGLHLVLEVDTDKAVADTVNRMYDELRRTLRKDRIRVAGIKKPGPTHIQITTSANTELDKLQKLLEDDYPTLKIETRKDVDHSTFDLTLTPEEVQRLKRQAADQALNKIRNRVDFTGTREPDIRPQGEKQIIVQLPGIKDESKVKDLLVRTGQIEFKLVDEINDLNSALQGRVPPGSQVLYFNNKSSDAKGQPILLKKRAELTGAYLTEARVQFDQQTNEPIVAIKFDRKGARIFERLTEANVGKRLAIVLDNEVYSAPVIRQKIAGDAIISGQFTDESAKDLALVLREAFPTPVETLYEKKVGPSLGADSIRKGLVSMLIGGALVILFMMIYYKGAGLIANLALIVNIILIAGGLAAFDATLTLPGIAGIILTIGMAVDANVLIFERIREELRIGKSARAAVDAGYDRATLTILDANVTTFIAALVLYAFGSGPVKGFAVTLSLGVVSSLFTALILSRAVFDTLLGKRRLKQLSI